MPRGASGTSVLFPHAVKGDLTSGETEAADVGEKIKIKRNAMAFHFVLILLVINEEAQF